MKLTHLLFYHVAIFYCSDVTNAFENPFLLHRALHLAKTPIKLLIDSTKDKSYNKNINHFKRSLSCLNEDKKLSFENKTRIIIDWMSDNRRIISVEKKFRNDHICNNISKLYSELVKIVGNNKLSTDLEFLNLVIQQGVNAKFFHKADKIFPYKSVIENLKTLLTATQEKLKKISIDQKKSPKFFKSVSHLISSEDRLIPTISLIDHECDLLQKLIAENHKIGLAKLSKTQYFKSCCSELIYLHDEFRRLCLDYIFEYESLNRIDEDALIYFMKENAGMFYYILSAFNVLDSMNAVLINLVDFITTPPKAENQKDTFKGWLGVSQYREPDLNIISDLATKLLMFCVKNDSALFEVLASTIPQSENLILNTQAEVKIDIKEILSSLDEYYKDTMSALEKAQKENIDSINIRIEAFEQIIKILKLEDTLKKQLQKIKKAYNKKKESESKISSKIDVLSLFSPNIFALLVFLTAFFLLSMAYKSL